MKRIRPLAIAVAVLAVSAMVIVGDGLLGLYRETARIREESRQFRAEAAALRLSTLSLVPSLRHSFFTEPPDGKGSPASETSRLFRTDTDGTILSGSPRSPGKTRILFLGGSTTECNEVDERRRFPAVVESVLRQSGIDVTAINAGVRGHTTQDSINALLNRPNFRDAEIVVLLHNINDRLALALRGGYSGDLGIDAPTSPASVTASSRAFLAATWDFVSYRSNALFLLRIAGKRFDPWTGEEAGVGVYEGNIDYGGDLTADRRALFEQNLQAFVAIVKSLGSQPVLATQPLGVDSRSQTAFNDSIRRIASQEQALLIDLDSRLGSDRGWAFLSDSIHLNNAGSKAVGQLIAASLGPLLGTELAATPPDMGILYPDELLGSCADPTDRPAPTPPRPVLGVAGRYPSFSPDGRWILLQSWMSGRDRLRAFEIPERRLVELTPPGPQPGERHPSFLSYKPDAFEIVFGSGFEESRPDSFERLMTRTWPGMQTAPLIPDERQGGAIPAVRGNEAFFAGFTAAGPGRIPDLYRLSRPDGSLARLVESPAEEWRPAISPDGTVFFISNAKGDFDIWRLRPGASQSELFQSSPAAEWDPAVSPDGKWLAFASKRSGNWDIYLTGTDGAAAAVPVTTSPSDDWDPAWHPSGNMLVFAGKQGEDSRIYGTCVFGQRK